MTNFSFDLRWTVAATESHGFKGVWTVATEQEADDLAGLLLAVGIDSIRYREDTYEDITEMFDAVTA